MKTNNKLLAALSNFLNADDAQKLALLLEETVKNGEISYETAVDLIGDDAEDILTLGYGWKLILPVRAAKGGDLNTIQSSRKGLGALAHLESKRRIKVCGALPDVRAQVLQIDCPEVGLAGIGTSVRRKTIGG